jgi:uncharacterized protein YbjQ (UPF0145 family)
MRQGVHRLLTGQRQPFTGPKAVVTSRIWLTGPPESRSLSVPSSHSEPPSSHAECPRAPAATISATTGVMTNAGNLVDGQPSWSPNVLVVTSNEVPGYRIVTVYGEVFGLVVRARNWFSNFGASLRTVVGGEVAGYTKLLTESREEALTRLRESAARVGANAVVAMRFDCNELADVMSEIAAYGTAVRLVPVTDGPRVQVAIPARHAPRLGTTATPPAAGVPSEQRAPRFGISVRSGGPAAGGLEVCQLDSDCVAQRAGLRRGDEILTVDGTNVSGASDLRRAMSSKSKGDPVAVTWMRDGETLSGSAPF